MVNGTTWEEETLARLREAREKQKQAQDTIKRVEIESEHWAEYADTLQKALELGKQQLVEPFIFERLRKQSTWKSLVDIMKANKGLLTVVDAVAILVDAKAVNDREHARNVIYSTLYSHKKDVQKVRKGVYQLSDNHIKSKRKTKKRTKRKRIPGLKKAILELKTINPGMTKQEVRDALLHKGFDFQGKSPSRAIHMAWLNMGYSEKEPEIISPT